MATDAIQDSLEATLDSIGVHLNFFTGTPGKTSSKLITFTDTVPQFVFDHKLAVAVENTGPQPGIGVVRDGSQIMLEIQTPPPVPEKHTQRVQDLHSGFIRKYERQLLDCKTWRCDAHDRPQKASSFYYHFFKANHPADYLSMVPEVERAREKGLTTKPRSFSAEIIPALVAYTNTVHKGLGIHKVVEDIFMLLNEFGAYKPHISCIAVPVCSADNANCMNKAKQVRIEHQVSLLVSPSTQVDPKSQIVTTFTNNIGRMDFFIWTCVLPYTTVEGRPMCQRCGLTTGIKMCSKKCGFGYCGKPHQKEDWLIHKGKCKPGGWGTERPRLPVSAYGTKIRGQIYELIPRPKAPPAFPTTPIQYNLFVGEPTKSLKHFVFHKTIPVSYLDLDLRTQNSVVNDWLQKESTPHNEFAMDHPPGKCHRCSLMANSVQNHFLHPIAPTEDWKTRSKKEDAAMTHARLPYLALELARLGAFPEITGSGEELINKVLAKMGASGPLAVVIAIPICQGQNRACVDKADDVYRSFIAKVSKPMCGDMPEPMKKGPGSGIPGFEARLANLKVD